MEVYGCSVKKKRCCGQTMGLKPAQEPPRAKLSKLKVPICLILTTFWDEITFGHITQ